MLVSDAVKHFGSKSKIATALKKHKSTVTNWGEVVPEGVAYKIQAMTKGKVKVDVSLYGIIKDNQQVWIK